MPTERGTHPMWPIAPKNGAPETPQSQCRRPPHRPPTARPPSIPEIMLIAHTSRGTPIPCPYTNMTSGSLTHATGHVSAFSNLRVYNCSSQLTQLKQSLSLQCLPKQGLPFLVSAVVLEVAPVTATRTAPAVAPWADVVRRNVE